MSSDSLQPMLHEPRLPGSAPAPPVPRRPSADFRNTSEDERLLSLLAGGVCIGIGAAKRGWIGLGFAAAGASLLYRGATGHCYTYQMLGIDRADHMAGVGGQRGVRISKSLQISRRPEEVAAYWEELPALPKIMRHLQKVEQLEGNRSHWVAKVLGLTFEWDAETTAFVPGREIRFRSLPGGDIDTEGAVLFEPTEMGGTLLRVEMRYDPPGGSVADGIAHWIGGDLETQIEEDLNRFKDKLEARQDKET
jgi:uncharacterized membrane protein